jgi:hypothetical protein
VSQADLVSELARHGLLRARLTAIVAKSADAAADKRAPGAADAPAPLSLDDVDLWPGRSGLHGSVDQGAHYATALGVVEFTVPWDELVPKGADLSFLPDRWGH